ncbi:MAG: sigma factor-like helix-turn-helix DNA-binding protein [Candidatus Faecousia sp.]|nr:sigma factor-like helix-turn-helix DNA-binding protein [Candidatus Faecousia sp.]
MTLEEFHAYQEQTFDAFCKAVIRNESVDAHRELAAKAKQEVSMSALSADDLLSLSVEDTYNLYCKTYYVGNSIVHVCDPMLGEALQFIPPQRRNILLLFYFLGYSEPQIGRLLGISTSTVHYRRDAALRRLRELLEAMEYGR